MSTRTFTLDELHEAMPLVDNFGYIWQATLKGLEAIAARKAALLAAKPEDDDDTGGMCCHFNGNIGAPRSCTKPRGHTDEHRYYVPAKPEAKTCEPSACQRYCGKDWDDKEASCHRHAVDFGVFVPIEPSRPVTGEAKCDHKVNAKCVEPGGCEMVRLVREQVRIADEAYAAAIRPLTMPPAPGNHPGTLQQRTCSVSGCWGPSVEIQGGVVVCAKHLRGKPDEAPLSERLFGVYMRLPHDSAERSALIQIQTGIRALEAKLAEAELRAQHGQEGWDLANHRTRQWKGAEQAAETANAALVHYKVQLATRDARIAELEASYAADKAAAVMEGKAAGVRACYAAMIDGNVPDGTSDFEEGDNLMMAEVLRKLGIGWEDLNGSSGAPAPTAGK